MRPIVQHSSYGRTTTFKRTRLISAQAGKGTAADTHFYFTGASLGGGAVNQMADIASSEYAGRFAAAQFVAFASPIISNTNGILNVGFENDPIYKSLENYSDQPSSLDNLVLATAQYMAGNYDGRHPLDYYAHSSSAFDVFARLEGSAFYDFMSPDSVRRPPGRSPDGLKMKNPASHGVAALQGHWAFDVTLPWHVALYAGSSEADAWIRCNVSRWSGARPAKKHRK